MAIKLTNNAESTLAGAIDASATTILLSTGTGVLFPQLANGDTFMLTLVKLVSGVPVREIVKVTARNVDACAVVRGQEGTVATSFSAGDKAFNALTAGVMSSKFDTSGGAISGTVDMAGNTFTNAKMVNCAQAFNDNAAANTINIANGTAQKWSPGGGPQTLTITGWPAAGMHGELVLYGNNLGGAIITIAGNPVNFINDDRTFTTSNSLTSNHGVPLKSSGVNIIGFMSPDGGVTRYAKVIG